MAKVSITAVGAGKQLTTNELEIGDVGVISNNHFEKRGQHILRHYEGYVLLENPEATWTGKIAIPLATVLRKGSGTVIEMAL